MKAQFTNARMDAGLLDPSWVRVREAAPLGVLRGNAEGQRGKWSPRETESRAPRPTAGPHNNNKPAYRRQVPGRLVSCNRPAARPGIHIRQLRVVPANTSKAV